MGCVSMSLSSSQCFKSTQCLLNTRTTHPTTQYHIPEDLTLNYTSVRTSIFFFFHIFHLWLITHPSALQSDFFHNYFNFTCITILRHSVNTSTNFWDTHIIMNLSHTQDHDTILNYHHKHTVILKVECNMNNSSPNFVYQL